MSPISEVRPGVEPGPPLYERGVPPKTLADQMQLIPDGIEPSFPGCEPGVVTVGPRDHLCFWILERGLSCPCICTHPSFLLLHQRKAAVAGIEPAILSLTGSSLTVWPTPQINSGRWESNPHEAGPRSLWNTVIRRPEKNEAPSGSRTRTACMGGRQATLTSWVQMKKAG